MDAQMDLKLERLDKGMGKLTVGVPAARLEEAINKAYRKNKGRIQIPGFRKGKASRQIIEKMYGKGVFLDDAANDLIHTYYDLALEQCEEEIVSYPEIDVEKLEAGEDFVFTAVVALKPEVELGDHTALRVEAQDVSVSDAEVEERLRQEREKNARQEVVEDRPAAMGDTAVIDFEGFVDGAAFAGGKGENHPLVLGSGSFIPGFEEGLVGASVGEEREVKVCFPEDYHEESLAGKEAVFVCKVKELKEKILPELDDAFAADVSEFDTLEEYKADVRAKLAKGKEEAARAAKEDRLVQGLIDASKMEIPQAMLTTKQRQMVDEFGERMRMQGLSLEQYMQFTGNTQESMMEQVKEEAKKRIEARLVLEALAKKLQLEASEEELLEEMDKMAKSYVMDLEAVRERLGQSGLRRLRTDLAIAKAAKYLVENCGE